MRPPTIEAIADELLEAGRNRTPVPRLTARYPEMTVEDSYAVQRLWRRRNEAAGRTGSWAARSASRPRRCRPRPASPSRTTARSSMTWCSRPAARVPWDRYTQRPGRGRTRVRAEDGPRGSRLHHLRRPDRHRLRGPGPGDPGLADRDGGPDDRGHHRRQRRVRRHGARRQPTSAPTPWTCAGSPRILYKNETVEETGVAAGVLDHPANGVHWLANKIAAHGDG